MIGINEIRLISIPIQQPSQLLEEIENKIPINMKVKNNKLEELFLIKKRTIIP
jgi:hypothetical protein